MTAEKMTDCNVEALLNFWYFTIILYPYRLAGSIKAYSLYNTCQPPLWMLECRDMQGPIFSKLHHRTWNSPSQLSALHQWHFKLHPMCQWQGTESCPWSQFTAQRERPKAIAFSYFYGVSDCNFARWRYWKFSIIFGPCSNAYCKGSLWKLTVLGTSFFGRSLMCRKRS